MEVFGGFGIALNLAAEAPHVDGQEVAGEFGVVAPDGFEELVAMERAAAVAGEGVEEFELPLREGKRAAVDGDEAAAGIDLETADLDRGALLGLGVVVGATKLRAHPGQQLARVE